VRYAVLPTLLSILPAVLATRAAFGLISRAQVSTARIHLAGSLLAVGIGLMHFTGMAAMRMAPLLR
jgi:NO-binding membrane sensor protein with MHYT domain